MPLEHCELLAVAANVTGELSCEPLVGDDTVTTGVVADAETVQTIVAAKGKK